MDNKIRKPIGGGFKSQTKTWTVTTTPRQNRTCTMTFDELSKVVGFLAFKYYVEGSWEGISDTWTGALRINGTNAIGGWLPPIDGSNVVSFTTYIDVSSSSSGVIRVEATAVGY